MSDNKNDQADQAQADHAKKNPSEKEPLLLDHDYDGIRELDHFLPRWWLGILYGTIIFSVGYFAYYHMGPGDSLLTEFQKDKQANDALKAVQAGNKKAATESELAIYVTEPEKLKIGKAVFASKCVACHGPQGQGLVGPNLTDDYWLNGGKLTDIARIVTNGVADKGMPPWGPILTQEELYSVVGFVKSLHGTNPPNPKAPQGDLRVN